MGKWGKRKPKAPIGDPNDRESLYHHLRRWLAHLEATHYSPETVITRERYLRWFLLWCDERGLTRPQEITRPIIEHYQRHLCHYRKKDGSPLAVSTQYLRLIPIGLWFKWMTKQNTLAVNPASEIELPRLGMRLPKAVLTAKEAEAVLAVPDLATVTGLRDRAILETFYSTGMRRAELIKLHLHEMDFERGVVFVREGKGRKDRVIPIGERALAWVGAYLERARPKLVGDEDDGTLFLTHHGLRFSQVWLTAMLGTYVKKAGIEKRGSCHMFRHTAATLMLEGGADIRFIQAQLGHASLDSTQRYTLVSIQKLKEVHTTTHPGRMPEVGVKAGEDSGGAE